ncbi:hypothetical protein KHC28_24610 [Ancylobacter sonchi]|uniref:alpha/beta fold hydrolase n=1 Tax=Ancylobacter sonchi TaxID=1937790 RepID=UPI001BD602EA|nr:alpha/beta fold hydrolase [Ancylobacter sonchi]MBS7536830.1 hypothetical protein [Ancylobacter sonchi]
MTAGDAPDSPGLDASRPTDVDAGRRLVLFLPGHDPTDMDYHHGRFANQAGRFAKLWSCGAEVSARRDEPGLPVSLWSTRSEGPNWRQSTDFALLRWDDIVVALDERPSVVRLWRGLAALLEFARNGTSRRYFKATLRYGIFCLFPVGILVLFLLAGLLGGLVASLFAGWLLPPETSGHAATLVGLTTALLLFLGLFVQPGRRWRLHQALDDWDLARDYLHGRSPLMDERLERFTDYFVQKVQSGDYDEVVLVGHSLGATLALRVLVQAFARDPELGRRGTRLNLLTCGATIPKFSLHPDAGAVRADAARVSAHPDLFWAEYQARHDAINFYKYHPVKLCRAEFDTAEYGQPILKNANLKQMISREKLRALRWHIMRLHYQFLLANEMKAPYDFFMIALGPLPLAELCASRNGPISRFADDGSLLPPDTATDITAPAPAPHDAREDAS